MNIIDHATLEEHYLPGIAHRTLSGPRAGAKVMEVWMQTIQPGAATPVHRHDCEEVIVILRGSGMVEVEGESEPRLFGPNSTLLLHPNEVHRITNTGPDEMWIVAALSMIPVRAENPDGTLMPLPWDQSGG